jgi:hypothetical protein
MDAQLAAIYGTNQVADEQDTEKLAAAELLVKLAEDEGIDLNQFSDEEVAGMIEELYQPEQENQDASQEKIAEADFLGRVMAHSYTQEMQEIEKQANLTHAQIMSRTLSAGTKAGKNEALLTRLGKFFKGQGKNIKEGVTGRRQVGDSPYMTASVSKLQRAKKLAPAAGAAALLGGGGTVAAMHKHNAADLDKLAEERAYQMMFEQGWIDEQGNALHEPQVKEASDIESEVETRALQMLEASGYPVTWNQ